MSPENTSSTPDREMIAARAYELWEKGGSQHGRDAEHWYQAERELAGARAAEDGDLDMPPPDPPLDTVASQEADAPADSR